MGSSDLHRQLPASADFADTVQGEPPESAAAPGPAGGTPLTDSDIGLDMAGDADTPVAEKPTLSHIGRYALKTLLGEGGLGCVYEAWDPLLSRTVAVKTLQFDLDMPSRIALDRLLLNEARAAANLNHAHIVTVHDAGLSAHGVYIAMERLRGRDLRQMLSDGWHPTPDAATQIVRRVADALAYAHARGVVHCDIKPGNIFLTPKGKPKVLDFGIARAAHATSTHGEALIAGSPHYLAPEQLSGGVVDARSDTYSLGVVLYELLAGRKAFRGDTLEQIHAAVREGQATPLIALRPDLPPALCDVVMRAMNLDPERRFATASELSQALRQWAASGTPAEAPSSTVTAEAPAVASRSRSAWVAAAVCAGIALAGWWALAGTSQPSENPASASLSTTTTAAAPRALAAASLAAAAAPAVAPPEMAPATATPAAAASANAVPAADTRTPAAVKTAQKAVSTKARAASIQHEPVAAPASGTLQLAVSPWGEIEVDGRPTGTTPPLTRLSLPEGTHTITVRNTDFPPFTATVQVQADKPAVVRHRFGS